MWFAGFCIIYWSLVSMQKSRGEAWSGHVCTSYKITNFTERYCTRYDLWTGLSGAFGCNDWKTRQSTKLGSVKLCCTGWKHNGNKNCNIPTYVNRVPVNKNMTETTLYAKSNEDTNSTNVHVVKRQVNACGGHRTALTSTATLTSPNYPSSYADNLRCQWIIEAPINYIMVLRITNLDLEENRDCSYDYISIILGRNHSLETKHICTSKGTDLTFITRSNEAIVTFVTDGSNTKSGFSLEYQAVLNCGQYLTAQTTKASLTSPLYPSTYENNLYCIWTIGGPVNTTIVMEILYVDIEENSECSFDFLQFNLGQNYIFETGRICGKYTKDFIYISRSNEADVIFKTDGSVGKTGFSLKFHAAANCGGRLTAVTTSSTLSSPNYPYDYGDNLYCHWTIESPINTRIAIEIMSIELEENSDCSFDYLQIYIGEGKIMETGRICRYNRNTTNLITRSDKADVIFVTDGSIKRKGFSLNYKTVQRCGDVLTAGATLQNLTSPRYPSGYENNLQCIWTIKGPISSRIALSIYSIDIEGNGDDCNFDFLQISLGNDYILKTQRLCGSDTSGLSFSSGSNEVDVTFMTDHSVTKPGFALQYQAATSCGGRLMSGIASATLYSPNYPSQYEINLRCHWTIVAPVNHVIVINITDIDLEVNNGCTWDYLRIYQGNDYILGIKRICSRNNVSLTSISISDEVHVIFITDASRSGRGFALQYQSVMKCGGSLIAQSPAAKLSSPRYPFWDDNYLRCHWTLEAPTQNVISVTNIILNENGVCSSGYVQLFIGRNYTFETDGNCGNTIQDLNLITMSNKADVIFVTNGTMTKTKFSLQFRAVPYCEGHLMAQTVISTLSSPNYPLLNDNRYCHWTIEAPINYRIIINVTNVEFETTSDCLSNYLQIFPDENDTSKAHRICMNKTEVLDFITISNKADIIYVTDGKFGFLLYYEAVYICGSHLIAQTIEEILTSPNYPSNYDNNIRCQWTVEAPVDFKIAIHVTNIDLEGGEDCHDYLQFFLGCNGTSVTEKICRNNTEDLKFVTTCNRADVSFVTDAARSRTGFSFQYQAVQPCGGYLTAQKTIATLTSPHYPSQYDNNLFCRWTIEAPINKSIAIQITNIDLDDNNNCTRDYLQIHLGTNSTDRICMNYSKNLTIITVSNQAEVVFVTDANKAKKGFSLQYQAGMCYCEEKTGQVDCLTDFIQVHPEIYMNRNISCVKRSDDIPKANKAESEIEVVKILVPSILGLVVTIIITLGLYFYCRRQRIIREQEKIQERPYTELQFTATNQLYELRETNLYENVNRPQNNRPIQVSTIYENMRISK